MKNIKEVENLLCEIKELNQMKLWHYSQYKRIEDEISNKSKQLDEICDHERVKDNYCGHETEWVCKYCGL